MDSSGISLKEFLDIALRKKRIIFFLTGSFFLFSFFYALSLPNIYTSSALLASSKADQNQNMLSQMGGLAALGELAFQDNSVKLSNEAIERIKTFDFFSKFFLPNISLQNLIAVKSWNSQNDSLTYNSDMFDDQTKMTLKPFSLQKSFEIYKKIVNITENQKTSFIKLDVKHKSPNLAKKFNKIIINQINESMREEDKKKTSKSIDFLNFQTSQTQYGGVKSALSKLQEEQMKTLMLIESDEFYIFKILDSPIAPEKKSEPIRSFIVFLGTLMGLLISILSIFSIHYIKEYNQK